VLKTKWEAAIMAEKDKKLEASKAEVVESSAMERTRELRCFVPKVDIHKTGDAIEVAADMPGVNKDSLEITLDKDILTINGFTCCPDPEGYSLYYSEYENGDYERSFRVSGEIDRDKIEAMVSNGVLHLRLPISTTSKAKRIEVKSR
jgi:HSP20 family protein